VSCGSLPGQVGCCEGSDSARPLHAGCHSGRQVTCARLGCEPAAAHAGCPSGRQVTCARLGCGPAAAHAGCPFGAPGDMRPPGQWTGSSAHGLPIRAPSDVRTLGLPAAQLTQATLTPAPVRMGSARVGASQLVRLCTVRPRDTPLWRSWSLMVRQASAGGTTAATRTIMGHDRARVGVAGGRTGYAAGVGASGAQVVVGD
jgi:hypothetical protein